MQHDHPLLVRIPLDIGVLVYRSRAEGKGASLSAVDLLATACKQTVFMQLCTGSWTQGKQNIEEEEVKKQTGNNPCLCSLSVFCLLTILQSCGTEGHITWSAAGFDTVILMHFIDWELLNECIPKRTRMDISNGMKYYHRKVCRSSA